jgi:hypothetical protein
MIHQIESTKSSTTVQEVLSLQKNKNTIKSKRKAPTRPRDQPQITRRLKKKERSQIKKRTKKKKLKSHQNHQPLNHRHT